MKAELISIIETLKYPVFLQGSLEKSATYPDSFFTFWNDETTDNDHFDNDAIAWDWRFSVFFYSIDPTLVNTVPLQAISALKSAGWIIPGRGSDVASDEITHTGRMFSAYKIELNQKGAN